MERNHKRKDMVRNRLSRSALGGFLACIISASTVNAEHATRDADPYISPFTPAPQAEPLGNQAVEGDVAGTSNAWISDEIWLVFSVVIAVLGVTIMRKTVNQD
jgi:hypothetical protein